MSLSAGQHITDSLRLVRLIGRGAMGSVWLADHLRLQSQVAVKFMAPAVADDEVSVRRFQQEARAAAEIRSPHVVQVFDHGRTDDGQLYIVMELLEGSSLDRRVKDRGVMNPTECASVVVQACKALATAHARGILHRDIKPANVFLLDASGEAFVKLLDFGVAKFSGEEAINMTAAGNMVGTPAFMSPEQLFHGHEVDHRGDLWSLCVVSYFALTGNRPFLGKTLGELCMSIKRGEFVAPSAVNPSIGPELDAWFERAFHADILQRFQTAKELAQELEVACGVSSVMTSTPSAVATPQVMQTFPGTSVTSHSSLEVPPERRRWPVVVGAAAIVAIGIGGAAVLLGDGTPEPSPAVASTEAAPSAEPTTAPEEAEAPAEEVAETSEPAEEGAGGAAEGKGGGIDVEVEIQVPKPRPAGPLPKPQPSDDREKRASEELGI